MTEKIKQLGSQTKIIAAVALMCLIVTVIMSINSAKYISRKKVTIQATVSMLEYYDNSTSDGIDCGYRVYADYLYAGKAYTDVYCRDVTGNTELKTGDITEIEVYADNPGEVAHNTSVNALFFLAAALGLTGYAAVRIKKEISA